MIIPDFLYKEHPSAEENLQSLIESLSKEKAAMAKLIRLEGDKIKNFAGEHLDFPFVQTPVEILTFIQSAKRINDLITMKGWLLDQKLQNIVLLEKKIKSDDFYTVSEEEEE